MWKIVHARNAFLILAVVLVVFPITLFAGYVAVFAYRTNSCGPGDQVLRSETDAIAVAKKKIVKNAHFSSSSFGSAPDFVDSLDQRRDCCSASRKRNIFGASFGKCL
jgi:hypothetical protein